LKRFKNFILLICIILLFLSNLSLLAQPRRQEARILKNSGIIKTEKINILNSASNENNISITPDGKYIFFMSERKTDWSTRDTLSKKLRYDGNIWFSKKIYDKWNTPKPVSRTINTPQNEDEPNISPDGQSVYFQSWKTGWDNSGGPYFTAELSGEFWKNPVGLNSGITEFFKSESSKPNGVFTDGSTFSADGKIFIFAAGEDYFGNMDLYISRLNKDGKWSFPEKLAINTPYNERCPFLAADGTTLYFSSNGYTGFGKMDIYKTTMNQNGSFGEVINLGEPINTKEDDYGFQLTASGDESYFVRNGEIYYADLKNTTGELKPSHTIILSGIVRDALTKDPLEATVTVIDPFDNRVLGVSRSNSATGEYSIILQRGKRYRQIVSRKDYTTFYNEFELKYDLNVNEIKFYVDLISPELDLEPDCRSRLYETSFSLGVNPAMPLAVGLKTELNSRNFGFALIGMLLPTVGEYDNPKPPESMMSDNYSTIFMLSITYNIPTFDCSVYPYLGIFTGYRTRQWKKPLVADLIGSGNYSDFPFGGNFGIKAFLDSRFFIEGAVGIGRFAFHELITGEISRYEVKFIPWISIAYKF
jgi:hypothetical protein